MKEYFYDGRDFCEPHASKSRSNSDKSCYFTHLYPRGTPLLIHSFPSIYFFQFQNDVSNFKLLYTISNFDDTQIATTFAPIILRRFSNHQYVFHIHNVFPSNRFSMKLASTISNINLERKLERSDSVFSARNSRRTSLTITP